VPTTEAFSRLLLTLYAAPTSPELWPRFLKEFVEYLDLPAAIMHQDGEVGNGFIKASVGLDPGGMGL
jgi:hypothetical protein